MATKKQTAKTVSKKPVFTKSAKPAKKAEPAKKVATKAPSKGLSKSATKNVKKSPAKSAKPINKSASVKKAAKPVTKKAAPKKLSTPKKSVPAKKATKASPAKATTKASKPAVKKAEIKKPAPKKVEAKAEIKPVSKPLPKAKDIKVPAPKPVILPKITTTKSRKYEPEFTKSVLDPSAPESNGPTMRYSDAELNEFKELILRKLETAKKELAYLQGLITRKDEMGGDDTDNRYMTMEDGSLSMEREQLSQMASRQITFIDHLEKAMMRIENKTYGICRVTGKLIDKARLRAVPHATLSIEAKMGIAK